MSRTSFLDNFSQLSQVTSLQNFNNYLHISDSPKIIVPKLNWDREKPRSWNVLKPRETIKVYRKLFRVKKPSVSRDQICFTQKCIKEIVRAVSLADNHCTSSDNADSDSDEPNIEFDYDNPQMLDVQGLDQMWTYRKDEQDLQIKREYEIMKRELDKRRLCVVEKERFEQQVRDEKFKLPDLYNIDIDPVFGETNTTETIVSDDGKILEEQSVTSDIHRDVILLRTKDKPKNCAVIEAEMERRVTNLQDRFMKLWEKEKEAEKKRLELEQKTKEELSFTLAQSDFQKLYEEKKQEEIIVKPLEPKPPMKFPNTFKELRSFRRKINRIRRETRDKCIVRDNVFQEISKDKFCKEKHLEVDNLSDDIDSMSAQSSDGEDGLEMGYKNSQEFLIRGMHDKFSDEPRGKFLNRGKDRTIKTCLNRQDWIQSTFTDCERKKSLRRVKYDTNDVTKDSYDIFHSKWRYVKPQNVKSPVKEYIEKGGQKILEISTKTKTPKFKQPKSVKVRTFNLTDYLYGSRKDKTHKVEKSDELEDETLEKSELLRRLKHLEHEEREQQRKIRHQRMKYLGFKCSNKKSKVQKKTIKSDIDSDWLPEPEPQEQTKVIDSNILLKTNKIPLKVSNMRAPDFREPTLKRHPRRPRQNSPLNVHENDSRAPLNVARLEKMDFDVIRQSNLQEEKKELNEHFKYRHHHDHLDHTQQKLVRVKYIPKVQKFSETFNANVEDVQKTEDDKKFVDFPIKPENSGKDWSRYFPVDEKYESNVEVNEEEELLFENIVEKHETCQEKDENKSRFNAFIKSSYQNHISEATGKETLVPYKYPFATEYRQQIIDEQASAASCLSSASTSLCTNFTNDSGSFFIINDTKVPLDYLMKHEIPFARVNENHRQAKLIENEDEYHAPYLTVTNAGQQIEMKEMCVPKDKFYTQVTRDRAGIRNRLNVEHVDLDQQLIGFDNEKYKPRFG